MYIRTALTAALSAIILMVIPVAADESDALYKGKVIISNAGTEVEGGTTVLLELNTTAFQDAGMLDASFNNAWFESAAGASMAFMPDPSDAVDPQEWYFFYPWDLAAGDSLSYLYLGGPDMTPPIRYIPAATGMSTADAASMELGDEFAFETKGYVDTTQTSARFLYKEDALEIYVSAAGYIGVRDPTLVTMRPTGFSDPDSKWTNEATAYDDNLTTYAVNGYALADHTFLYLTFPTSFTDEVSLKTYNQNGDTLATLEYQDTDDVWHTIASGTVAPTGDQTWSAAIPGGATQIKQLRIKSTDSSSNFRLYEIWWDEIPSPIVEAAVASGAHTVRVEADGTDISLSVDGVLEDTAALGGWSVADNANGWSAVTGGAMPYVEYVKVWVSGGLVQHVVWEDDTTFTDLSGTGNDATPSFPAASSDADVSASLLSLEPISPASAPSEVTETGGFAGDAPTEPDNMYTEMDVDHLPGAALINALLDAGDIPRTLFWFPLTFIGIVVLGLLTYKVTKSLMGMGLVASVALVFASRAGIVPYWVTVPLILIAVAILVKEKMSPL